MEILDHHHFILPSELINVSLKTLESILEEVDYKIKGLQNELVNVATFGKKDGKNMAQPINKNPREKTKVLIEDYNVLENFYHNLNQLREYREKVGSGILYFNNPYQLLDRLELLGGSILAGNNGVIQEFSQIAHLLYQMKVITKKQLNLFFYLFIYYDLLHTIQIHKGN